MALHAAIVLLIFFTANILAYLYLFCEQFLFAKSQQRIGPNRAGWHGFQHALCDYSKSLGKRGVDSQISKSFLVGAGVLTSLFLPYVFIVILLYPLTSVQENYGGFLTLYMVLFFSLVIDNLFVFAFQESASRLLIRRHELLTLLGITIFLMANMVPLLRMESPTLVNIQIAQAKFPFFLLLKSPFVFVAGIISFLSIFFILPSPPLAPPETRAFTGIRQNLFILSRILWTIGIFGLWVTIYLGGNVGGDLSVFNILSFLAKLTVVVLLFLWVRRSFPAMRLNDSLEFGFKRLLPICSVAVLGEMIWLALWKL